MRERRRGLQRTPAEARGQDALRLWELGGMPRNRTNQTAACVARLSASMDDEFPPDTWELSVSANHGGGWASHGRNLGRCVPAERVDARSCRRGSLGARRCAGQGRHCPASTPLAEATTRAAHRATAELHIASGEALLHKSGPRRPDDHVGQGAAIVMTMILLRIAECQEGTVPLSAGPIGAERQQTDDQRRSQQSHRSCSPPRVAKEA
jgi:hypothetical protein